MYSLFVTRGYPTKKYKMQGIFELDQAKALVKNNQKVVYIALDLRSIRNTRKWGYEKLNIDNVEIHCLNLPLGGLSQSMIVKIGTFFLKVLYKKIVKIHGLPKVVHAHFPDYAYMASELKLKSDQVLVVTEHTSKIESLKKEDYLYKIAKLAYDRADKVLAVSESLANIIENKFNVKVSVVPNMVDSEIFNFNGTKINQDFTFVSTGNLILHKRMEQVIKAFSTNFKNVDNVYLNIFGAGPEKANLEKLIIENNLDFKVKLYGLTDRIDIANSLKVSNCFVLASKSETFGVAFIEAMASGLPVIATKCGGPQDFVNASNGVMVDVDNQFQLEKAMLYMYNNIDQFDSQTIASETIKRFSPNVVATQIIDIYNELLK